MPITIRLACQAWACGTARSTRSAALAADGAVYVLEVAARPIGGLCSRVLTFARAGEPRRAARWKRCCCGTPSGESIDGWSREAAAAAVMMIPIPSRGMYKGVEGEAGARAVPGVTDVRITAKVGQLLETLPEAGSYLGFIFARGELARDAGAAVRTAHRELTLRRSRA